MNNKYIFITSIFLVLIFGISGYYLGFSFGKSSGRSELQSELKTKEESYKKSTEMAREITNKFISALKFGDYEESYSLTCPDFKKSISQSEYIIKREKDVSDAAKDGNVITNYAVQDVIIDNNSAKFRITATIFNPLFTKEIPVNQQGQLFLIDNNWCISLDVSNYK